jgi:hypothetical protein
MRRSNRSPSAEESRILGDMAKPGLHVFSGLGPPSSVSLFPMLGKVAEVSATYHARDS